MTSLQRSNDKPQVHPFTTTSSSRNQGSVALENADTQGTHDLSSTTFRRLRTSFEQSFRTATRSKVKAPPNDDDEFGTITLKDTGTVKACRDNPGGNEQSKDKGRSNMLKKLETRVGLRFVGRDSAMASSTPIAPGGDQSREHVNNADKTGARVAGWRSFMTPSLRQGSVSSPTLHLSSQALPSPVSQEVVMAPSTPPNTGSMAPSRDRTRRASAHPATREISAPHPLAPRREPRNSSVSPEYRGAMSPTRANRHRPSPISPSGPRSSLAHQLDPGGQYGKSSRQSGSANTSQISLSSQPTPLVRGRTVSPTHTRTPTGRIVTPTSNHGVPSPSLINLPSDAGSPSTSPTPPRRPSVDTPGIPRRGSVDTQRKVSPSPRAVSPAGTARSRTTSPSQRTSVYAHSRSLNMSAVSLASPSTPEQRELIRLAITVLCKELRKPPPHLSLPVRQKEWAEVEVRLQPLIRVERMRGMSSVLPSASSSQVAVANMNSTVLSNAGEERERKLFYEALRDGVILCQFMNKYRPTMIPRVDPREDGSKRTTNITKFLAACSSQGLPSDDLFYRDDLIEATPETLCRVARTIIALPKLFETSTVGETKVMTGRKSIDDTVTAPDNGPHASISHSLGVASPPHPSSQRPVTPSGSYAVLVQKRWPPPEPPFLPLRSDSPHSGTSNDTARNFTLKNGHSSPITTQTWGSDLNSDRPPSLPPKSPLHTQYYLKHSDDSGGSRLSTIKPIEFPKHEPLSRCSSPIPGDYGGDLPVRQSRTSSNLTDNTAYSSIFDLKRNTSVHNKFGTVRTVTTEATSLGSEIPSFTRTEASSLAASLAEEMAWRRSTSTDATRISERRPSEPVVPDLVSLAEEEETSACGSSSRDTHQEKPKDLQANREVVRLGKGKWPDDFVVAFQAAGPSLPTPTSATTDYGDSPIPSSSLSVSPGRKLSIVTPPKLTDASDALPRRPSHHSNGTDTSILMPRESVLRTDIRSDSPSTGGSRVILRRPSTRNGPLRRNGSYVPRNTLDGSEKERNLSVVPFPRAVSGDHSASASPTPDTPRTRDRSTSQDISRIRGRFQNDIDDSRFRRRSRPNSYGELGRSRHSSDLRSRDSMDGSGIRQTIIVEEEGTLPIHYQLGNCIGRGQFGTVYRALNMTTGQMVAVKRIRLEGLKEEDVTQLMNEVDLMKSLSHPSIVKYEGMARDDDTLDIVLEYAESGSLGQTLRSFGKLNEHLVSSYVVKILEGLHYLHRCQVVHCDLKAANILTTKTGNVKLSDFGVSLNLRAMQREMNNVAGTPNWMAPEVIELKGASTKSDIWSLGCTVIELLTGRPPYGDITNMMFRIVEDNMPPLPEDCSDALQDFLQQCFHKDPELRPDAETLCKHPWLTSSWEALKELRPQDSIPFLRRVSTDLQRKDVSKLLAHINLPVAETSAPEATPQEEVPSRRRPSIVPVTPLSDDTPFTPRDHTFIKIMFGKPVVCRVCLGSVKKNALICDKCSLIAHSQCAREAPPTCDLRSQLLQYAQLAGMTNPPSTPSNPTDPSGPINTGMTNFGEVSFATSSPRRSADLTYVGPATSPTKGTSGLKFIGGVGRSRSSLSVACSSASPSPVPPPHSEVEEKTPRRVSSKLSRNVNSNERPQSVSSDGTATKSQRTTDSRSSRQEPSRKSHLSAPEPNDLSQVNGMMHDDNGYENLSSHATSLLFTTERRVSRNFPGAIPQEFAPQKKRGDKTSNCVIQ
ncbi:Pkinase-domain-containing protein [Scleroderma citrinum]